MNIGHSVTSDHF